MLVALGTVHACAGYSGLHMACVWGRPGCVRELVEGGGDHRLATVHHETPQQLAMRYGNSECAEYLSCVGQFPLVFDLHGAGSEGYMMYGVSGIGTVQLTRNLNASVEYERFYLYIYIALD